jgi:hypothetical protein
MKARCAVMMVIAVLRVAACDGSKEQREAQTTIRFAAHDRTVTEIYDDLRASFEEENPDLHIEFVSLEETLDIDPRGTTPIPENAAQRLVEAADVVHWLFSREMVEQGLLRDLAPLIEADAYRSCVLAGDHRARGTWQVCVRQTDPTLLPWWHRRCTAKAHIEPGIRGAVPGAVACMKERWRIPPRSAPEYLALA